ncbi:hypothetical protein [Mesoterricola silvestris]|uniref:Uncharacterized protein n=1 Tax=Mesoterricola silvestris TaxID=2927979 RepID=A0AA48GK47_9BACT|nr:hypothetical protein [Mesoterricola silvestris]BDU72807.1 hypothetical protein METEAL_19810 [Mesoterricola silvestris]
MIPDKANPCWRHLVTGKNPLQTEMLGLQMLLKRMQRRLVGPHTDADVTAAAEEVHGFFLKYEGSLANELRHL